MDVIDRKIICELDMDCRVSLAQIARKLRINRNVAAYRIASMEEKKIISSYICSVNLGLLGYKTYKIFFKIRPSSQAAEKKFVQALIKDPRVIHLLKSEGFFDYSAAVAVKSLSDLDDLIMAIKGNYKQVLSDYFISIIVYSKIFKLHKFLLGKVEDVPKFERYSGEEKSFAIDEKDKSIIKKLSQSANLPIVNIAKETGLSIDIVRYRIAHLQKNKVITNRVLLNFNALGYYHYVIILRMRKASREDEQKLVEWCAVRNNVIYCTKRIDYFDFEINAIITDINDLNKFLQDLKTELNMLIDSYETVIHSKLLKLNYIPF